MKLSFFLFFLIFTACNENPTEIKSYDFNVNIRFEVKILDAQYKLYSVPFTQIYFTTYKLDKYNQKVNLELSDTTSCPNGWGVKELTINLSDESEIIILGAACKNYEGANYTQVQISYNEAKTKIDSTGAANINKTHIIYY